MNLDVFVRTTLAKTILIASQVQQLTTERVYVFDVNEHWATAEVKNIGKFWIKHTQQGWFVESVGLQAAKPTTEEAQSWFPENATQISEEGLFYAQNKVGV